MKDYLGNNVEIGDTVLVALKSGRAAMLTRAYVLDTDKRPQFKGGLDIDMVRIQVSNITSLWRPARHVAMMTDEMLPEKRREKLNNVEEAIQPS